MSDRYNYLAAVTNDVREYIRNEIDLAEWKGNRDGLKAWLNDVLWTADSVTGNACGSYYCNAWAAEEALAHNLGLLAEALREFGEDGAAADMLDRGAEDLDVTIRCYLLDRAIAAALDELDELDEPEEEE